MYVMYESQWTNELMTYVLKYIYEWVPNLKWLKDSLSKVWIGHKRCSLEILSLKDLGMTLVREMVD